MRDLRAHRVDVVTIGQYLQPTARHLPLDRWVTPEQFRGYRDAGEAMGFGTVFAGPLVRSSYRAGRLYKQAIEARQTSLS
jgi:lipoic acid synthetase